MPWQRGLETTKVSTRSRQGNGLNLTDPYSLFKEPQPANSGGHHIGGYDFRKSYDNGGGYDSSSYDDEPRHRSPHRASYDDEADWPRQRSPYRANYDDYDYQPRRASYDDRRGPVVGGNYGNRMAAAGDSGITYNKNGGIDWNHPTLKGSIFVDRGYDDASFDITQNLKMASVVDPGKDYHTGKGTYYDVETHKSSCGIKATNKDLVAAMNSKQFGGKTKDNKKCGQEIEVTGPSGKTVKAKLIDGCDTCAEGDIDLSPAGESFEFS